MNILYIAHRIPYPPDKGDKIRTHNTIRFLAQRHRVWCACFVDDAGDFRHVAALRAMCEDVVALPLRRLRASVSALLNLAIDESASDGFYHDPAMVQAIVNLGQRVNFDAVIAFSSTMAQYAQYARAKRKLVDLCDLDSQKWAGYSKKCRGPRSWFYRTESDRLSQRERDIARQFDATILISREEANDLKQNLIQNPQSKPQAQAWGQNSRHTARAQPQRAFQYKPATDADRIAVVANGVTLPAPDEIGGYDHRAVGFVGDMRYQPNEDAVRWFAGYVWPQISSMIPDAVLRIIGRNPSPRVTKLAQRGAIEVTGEVKSVVDELARLQCVVAPLQIARGVQNKVLEAMAAARPVVATTAAATGIDAHHGRHILIADAPTAFANHVVAVLRDPNKARSIGAAARQLTERSYQWDARLEALQSVLQ